MSATVSALDLFPGATAVHKKARVLAPIILTAPGANKHINEEVQ